LLNVAVDTNVLAYAEGIDDAERQASSRRLMLLLSGEAVVIPVQVLGELYNVLVRKGGWSGQRARIAIAAWRNGFVVAPTTEAAIVAAFDLAADHRLSIWDSVILCVAAESGCRLLLSEDMQDGFSWGGVTVVNPFASSLHPLFEAFLAGTAEG
jgi:predicted nucleic acid-binding protein